MAFKLTNSKELAIKNFIYEWLKDPTYYCSVCGTNFMLPPEGCEYDPCCDRPDVVTNYTAMVRLLYTNKMIRETRQNQFGSDKKRTIRSLISMTPRLWEDIERYCIMTLKEPFLKDDKEAMDFCMSFPQFRTCQTI